MSRTSAVAVPFLLLVTFAPFARVLAQTAPATQPATQPADGPAARVDALRDQLKAAYQKDDVEAMLKYLHPQVVIIFPDGEILRGRDALVGYYNKMLKGPDAIVAKYTSDPVVSERAMHGDAVVSYGMMNDQYALKNGMEFGLNSRFTVSCVRTADGPPETDGWVIRSFHSSTDAFDNPVLRIAAKRMLTYGAIGGALAGVILGLILGRFIGRRRPTA